jgi:hypothetical protein
MIPMIRFAVLSPLLLVAVNLCHADSSAPYIGNWLQEDSRGFSHLSLQPQGGCKFVGGEKDGGALLGVRCTYTVNGNSILVNISDETVSRDAASTLHLRYVKDADIIEADGNPNQSFHRTQRSELEVYESWRK